MILGLPIQIEALRETTLPNSTFFAIIGKWSTA
jgi:hypothetical protein